MEENRDLNTLRQCRLCGIFGFHEIDILNCHSRIGHDNPNALSEKIFKCVDVRVNSNIFRSASDTLTSFFIYFQVKSDDETTGLCDNCHGKIDEIVQFREICAATNNKIKKSYRTVRDNESSGNIAAHTGLLFGNSPVPYIPLIDDENNSDSAEANARPKMIKDVGNSCSSLIGDRGVAQRKDVEMDLDDFLA